MTWERIREELQRAYAQWQLGESHLTAGSSDPLNRLSRSQANELLAQARELLGGPSSPSGKRYSALIVTKAPHTGSDHTVAAILARCLAFGLTVERVMPQDPGDAERIAHALYPDVWLNFIRLPSGNSIWSQIDAAFDKDDYEAIFGERYERTTVVTGHQACVDNRLTHSDLMSIWQTGREPLTHSAAVAAYGSTGAATLFGRGNRGSYQWYRGTFPVGIHRIRSNLMAFSLRHERLYDGRPIIILNGHFTLLSRQFRGIGNHGPTVIELGLEDHPTIGDVRQRLIGAADQPSECLPGTMRRDALDGFFCTDAPGDPVVPWANAVHASDGYLAGAIETAAILGGTMAGAMAKRLISLGYAPREIDTLIMKDPVVVAEGDEQRLTKRTAMLSTDECIAEIQQWFPPLGADGSPPVSTYLLSAMIGAEVAARSDAALDQPHPQPGSRRPQPGQVHDCVELPESLGSQGEVLMAAGGLGLLVPLAGSGGRFGGYDVAEGKSRRLKALLPVFSLGGLTLSSLDIRAAHVRFIARRCESSIPMFLSCSHITEPKAREWLATQPDIQLEIARVPEMYRIKIDDWDANAGAPEMTGADDILRSPNGTPLLKPSGSLGLLISAAYSGTLSRWQRRGVRVVVAANADDVAFRVDPRIVGLFAASPGLDAVVLTTPCSVDVASDSAQTRRGGLLREQSAGDGWSVYVEEHAKSVSRSHHDQFSTNQVYFSVESLCGLFEDMTSEGIDSIRRRLPLYYEIKRVRVGDRNVGALHGYQTYGDVLRLMPRVMAVSMTEGPRPRQLRGYAPLKSPSDVQVAQEMLNAIGGLGDQLILPMS